MIISSPEIPGLVHRTVLSVGRSQHLGFDFQTLKWCLTLAQQGPA